MLHDLPSLAQLLKNLQQVPYLASKNIYRVSEYFLRMPQANVEHFCKVLLQAKQNSVQCAVCCTWQEKGRDCSLCSSPKRNQAIICVVETWQELLAIEKTNGYNGVYHVLGGVISPLDGIGPNDLSIEQLVARVTGSTTIQEIILAMNPTPEGEATASYIASKLKGLPITLSSLARGIPIGSPLEFMDRLTVYKALSDRRPF